MSAADVVGAVALVMAGAAVLAPFVIGAFLGLALLLDDEEAER